MSDSMACGTTPKSEALLNSKSEPEDGIDIYGGLMKLLGGSVNYYYASCFAFTATLMVFRPIVGWYCDKTRDILRLYNIMLPLAILSNLLYAFSPGWNSAALVVVVRGVSALGAASENLIFFYLNLAAKPAEKREWATYVAASRSVGYMIGPMLATGLSLGMHHLFGRASWRSPFGLEGIVGLALATGNAIVLIALNAVWIKPPDQPAPKPPMTIQSHQAYPSLPENMDSVQLFLRHWVVLAVVGGNFAGCFLGLCFESLIPPTTDSILGWDARYIHFNGVIFSAIGSVLLVGQVAVVFITKRMPQVSDGAVFLTGLGGMSAGCAGMTVLWSSIEPGLYTDPFGSEMSFLFCRFLLPALATAFFMPFCMNSSVALFMRLASHSLSDKMGLAQAWQMNVTSAAPLLCPIFQFFTYSADVQDRHEAPFTSLLLISLFGFLTLTACVLAKPHWGFK